MSNTNTSITTFYFSKNVCFFSKPKILGSYYFFWELCNRNKFYHAQFFGGACYVMVIVVGNRHYDPSSNPGRCSTNTFGNISSADFQKTCRTQARLKIDNVKLANFIIIQFFC